MTSLSSLAKDRVILLKADGKEFPETWATVTRNVIVIPDGSLPIEEGDTILRRRSGGIEERYLITDPGYYAGTGGILPHFQVRFEKQSKLDRPERATAAPVYNLIGAGSRVTIDSTDNSVNVVNVNSEKLFEDLKAAVRQGVAGPIKEELLAAIDELAAAPRGPRFAESYAEVIQLGANHMTILLPFLPALGQLLATLSS